MKLDIPFIIISGTVGETLAVEAMRSGANDYLMKDHLARLVPTIERELQEARNRRARREAEEALKASEAQLRLQVTALQSAGNAIVITDRDGNISWVNSAFSKLTGYSAEEVTAEKTSLLKSGYHNPEFYEDLWKRILSGESWRGEMINKRKNGSIYFEEQTITPVRDETGEIVNFIAIKQDVTERKRAEEERARLTAEIDTQRQRLDNIVASVPGVVWEFWGGAELENQRFDFVSDYVQTMLGYAVDEWLSVPNFLLSIIHPDDRQSALDDIKSAFEGRTDKFSFRWIGKDSRIVWAESSVVVIRDKNGTPTGMRGVTIDATNRKTLQEQLWQSQKMEAVGQLAGGVAHDFNNLLTAITGYSDLTIRRLPEDDPLRHNVEEIKKAGDRAAALTRQLLAFSRKQILQPQVLNLNSVAQDLEKMLHRLIGEDIELRTSLEEDLGNVQADPGQIEQVIVNLAVNARDAMPRGGKLTIETRNIYLDQSYADQRVAVKTGPHVMLAVSDTGSGMDEETQQRIFEPFFTTKAIGKGTGLGLSTVYGIISQSGGTIWVYSEVGLGTTFKIYLPRVDENASDYIRASAATAPLTGTETILLAEDEEVVRKLASQVLRFYGYQVIEAENGSDALRTAESYGQTIDLLLTDVVMPEMSGRELSQQIAVLRPEMKLLFMSGYTDDAVVHHGVLDAKTNFIQKPFGPEALARKVREVLDATE
jgi:PAS domain S-box-containing protein